jgi:hypothetical protein
LIGESTGDCTFKSNASVLSSSFAPSLTVYAIKQLTAKTAKTVYMIVTVVVVVVVVVVLETVIVITEGGV